MTFVSRNSLCDIIMLTRIGLDYNLTPKSFSECLFDAEGAKSSYSFCAVVTCGKAASFHMYC